MSAAGNVQALIDVLAFNDNLIEVMLTGMTDDLARRRLRDGGPSVAWNIGHLLYHRNRIAAAVSCEGPAIDLERYARSATDGQDYPSVREFRRVWSDFSGRLESALRRLTSEDLAAPSPMRLPHGEQTLLGALRFTVWHDTLHLGQITMLRSHHGLAPTVDLVRERASAVSA